MRRPGTQKIQLRREGEGASTQGSKMERLAGLAKTSPSAQQSFVPHSRQPVPVARPLQRSVQALPSRRFPASQPAVCGPRWAGVGGPQHLLQPVRGSLLQVRAPCMHARMRRRLLHQACLHCIASSPSRAAAQSCELRQAAAELLVRGQHAQCRAVAGEPSLLCLSACPRKGKPLSIRLFLPTHLPSLSRPAPPAGTRRRVAA